MDRYARRQHFERLCTLRASYVALGLDDTRSVISIEDVLAWINDELEGDDVAQFVAEDARSDAT
jgi:hypothetical protein